MLATTTLSLDQLGLSITSFMSTAFIKAWQRIKVLTYFRGTVLKLTICKACQPIDTLIFLGICWVICLVMILTMDQPKDPDAERSSVPKWIQPIWSLSTSLMQSLGNHIESFINALMVTKQRGQAWSNMAWTPRRWTARPLQLYAMSVIAMSAAQTKCTQMGTPFDTDSEPVGIDNQCSGCITHVRSNIPGDVVECKRAIKGFGGTQTFNIWSGTIHWKWDDDNGVTHTMIIPNSYYVPNGQLRLLSPQHWAQQRTGNDKRGGAGERMDATEVILYWNNKQNTKTVPLDVTGNNVATFNLAAGYDNFHAYCAEAGLDDVKAQDADPLTNDDLMAEDVVVSDDDDDTTVAAVPDSDEEDWPEGTDQPRQFDLDRPTTTEEHQAAPNVIKDEEDRVKETPTAKLLSAHHDFGHVPFPKLQEMAKQGILPRRLATCNVLVCSACKYAKATKRPWRSKTTKLWRGGQQELKPGQVVSVDQLVSPTPGLIAQMMGFLTRSRY